MPPLNGYLITVDMAPKKCTIKNASFPQLNRYFSVFKGFGRDFVTTPGDKKSRHPLGKGEI
jgi:hypothetical protein